MGSIDLLEFTAVAFAVCGLAFVVWEVLANGTQGAGELLSDVRRFAERPLSRAAQPAAQHGAADIKRKPAVRHLVA